MTINASRQSLAAFIGALFIALSAQFSFPLPGTDIPQTGQTMAVLLVAYGLGPLFGGIAVLVYLLLGLIGLPVYSESASGWAVLSGGSAGYFAGFVLAAVCVGALSRQRQGATAPTLLLFMLVGHAVILSLGCLWLSRGLGLSEAFAVGVFPFLYGGFGKSLLCVAIVLTARRLREVKGNGALYSHQ